MSTTFVQGQRVRVVRSDTFADLTDAPVLDIRADGVLFDTDLDAATVTAIRDRMTSRDDTDQAARAQLRAGRDAVSAAPTPETLEDALALIALLRTVVVDGLNYVLGDGVES